MSNLRLINESSGSSLSSYSVQDVFTSDFDIYQIEITEFQQTATFTGGMRFINSSGRLITERPEFYVSLTTMIIGSQFFLAGFLGELVLRNKKIKSQYKIIEKIKSYNNQKRRSNDLLLRLKIIEAIISLR